jgi:hypothetical protein
MATITEQEQAEKARKVQKAATDKAFFLRMVDHHQKQAQAYADRAAGCDVDVFEFAEPAPSGNFAGL